MPRWSHQVREVAESPENLAPEHTSDEIPSEYAVSVLAEVYRVVFDNLETGEN